MQASEQAAKQDPANPSPSHHHHHQNQVSFPRLSYLPVLLPQVLDFFSSWLIRSDAQAHRGWFSVNDVPMKWGLPAGLLYDLYAKNYKLASSSSSSSDSTKPWKLVVHFSEWPDNELVPLDRDGIVLHDAFINSVKEADFLRNGTAEHIMKLSKDDSHGLWQSLTTSMYNGGFCLLAFLVLGFLFYPDRQPTSSLAPPSIKT